MAKTRKRTYPARRRKANKEANPVIEPQETFEHNYDGINSKEIVLSESELQTTEAQPQDRMMRYGRNPICPICKSPSVIYLMGRTGYKKYRCRIRICRHVWEVFE